MYVVGEAFDIFPEQYALQYTMSGGGLINYPLYTVGNNTFVNYGEESMEELATAIAVNRNNSIDSNLHGVSQLWQKICLSAPYLPGTRDAALSARTPNLSEAVTLIVRPVLATILLLPSRVLLTRRKRNRSSSRTKTCRASPPPTRTSPSHKTPPP